MSLIIYLAVYAVYGCIFGFAADAIVKNKGYQDNWFWWGFFFGIIAVLVALSKPDINNQNATYRIPTGGPVAESDESRSAVSMQNASGDNDEKSFVLSRMNASDSFLVHSVCFDGNELFLQILPLSEKKIMAVNADIIFETVFGDKKTLEDIYFMDFTQKGQYEKSSGTAVSISEGFFQTVKAVDFIAKRFVANDEVTIIDDTELKTAKELKKGLFVESDLLIELLKRTPSTLEMKDVAIQFYKDNNIIENAEIMNILGEAHMVAKLYGKSDREKRRVLREISEIYYGADTIASEVNEARFCRNCGNKLSAAAVFCGRCGTKISI